MDYKLPYLTLFALVMFCIGAACIVFPHRVQSWAKRSVSMGLTGRIPALQRFVSSSAYVFHVRAVGIGALLMFVILALVAIKSS